MGKTKIGIIGLGMIGGSLALALNGKYDVLGYDNDLETSDFAVKNKFCEIVSPDKMQDCEAVFVCVPVGAMSKVLGELSEMLGDKTIITDVASVKVPFSKTRGRYVGGHPMAGTEVGGIRSAKKNLFENAYYVITDNGDDGKKIGGIVESLGAIPVYMTAKEHDLCVSKYSHVPHAVAYALVAASAKSNVSPIAGSGFMDTTRIAASDEKFWTDVFKYNRQNVSVGIGEMIKELETMQNMLDKEDYCALEAYIRSARLRREAIKNSGLGGEVLYVDLIDRVGEFERVTGRIAHAGINIGSISLVPGRDGVGGALRLEFKTAAERDRAEAVLSGYEEVKTWR